MNVCVVNLYFGREHSLEQGKSFLRLLRLLLSFIHFKIKAYFCLIELKVFFLKGGSCNVVNGTISELPSVAAVFILLTPTTHIWRFNANLNSV